MQKPFDVCIIGSGPAGIFSAIELAERYDIIVLELGNKFSKRQRCKVVDNDVSCNRCGGICNIIAGFGGSFSSRSGGTLSLYPAGSSLIEYYDSKEDLLADYEDAIKIWRKFSKDKMSFEGSTNQEDITAFFRKVNEFGGIYKHYNGYKLDKASLDRTVQAMEDYITSKARLEFNSEVISVVKKSNLWNVKCHNGKSYLSRAVVFATGRKGNSFISEKLKNMGVNQRKSEIDVGIRIEFAKDKIDYLAKLHPDMKIKFNINGEEVRTFCFCPKGKIIHFNQDSLCYNYIKINFLEGYIDNENLSDRTNISLLHRISFESAEEVFRFQRNFEEKYYSLGGRIIAQRLKDIGNTTFRPLPHNTTLKDYSIGSVFSLLPEKSVYILLEAINRFDKILEGQVIDENTVIAAPELGNFWPEIKMDKEFQTNISGIFVAGDALGFIRGALQGSVTGIKTSRAVMRFLD